MRSKLAVEYGGSRYSGGIVPSTTSPNVFLFTDKTEGAKFGYTYDGFSPDRSLFYYTGAGASGDQEAKGGNSAVLRHAERGQAIRLFAASGKKPGTDAKLQSYLGEYALDPIRPFERMPAFGEDKRARTVIVFRLLPAQPVGDFEVELAGTTTVTLSPTARAVPLEVNSSQFFETAATEGVVSERRESSLTDEFVESRLGSTFFRWAISLPREHTTLLTDVYDESSRVLYEAKAFGLTPQRADCNRPAPRLQRHISVDGLRWRRAAPSSSFAGPARSYSKCRARPHLQARRYLRRRDSSCGSLSS